MEKKNNSQTGINIIREGLGLSVAQIAEIASVSRQMANRWDKGISPISDAKADVLAKKLGVPMKYIKMLAPSEVDKIDIERLLMEKKVTIVTTEGEEFTDYDVVDYLDFLDTRKQEAVALENIRKVMRCSGRIFGENNDYVAECSHIIDIYEKFTRLMQSPEALPYISIMVQTIQDHLTPNENTDERRKKEYYSDILDALSKRDQEYKEKLHMLKEYNGFFDE